MSGNNAIYQWVHTVDYQDFDLRVLQASYERPMLVDLWAEWCSPCVVIAPVLERIIGEYAGRVHLAKVLRSGGNANGLDGTERNADVYLVAFDLSRYEIGYELNSRPRWALIPLKGISNIINN